MTTKEHSRFRITKVGGRTEVYITGVVHGTRTVAGVDWPIESAIMEITSTESGKRLGYRVLAFLCNGNASHSRDFRTLEAAKEYIGLQP